MKGQTAHARRAAAGLGLLALAGLLLQFALMLPAFPTPVAALWRFVGYFTLLTNAWVAIAMLRAAAGRPLSPRWMTALTLSILLVGVVYHVLLSATHHPVGLDWWANLTAHSLVPGLCLLYWLGFVDRSALSPADIPAFIAWPLAYIVYALARGSADGWYPYFFIEVPKLGWLQVLLNIAGLALAFAAAGLLFVMLGRGGPAGAVRP
jgi:hypothetical protein